VDRRGFLLAVGVGTFGVLTACELSAAESGTALPAPAGMAAASTAADPRTPVTPVLQRGAPAVNRIPPPGTVVSWVPDTPPLLALTIDDGVSSPVVGAYVALAKATGIRLTFFANGVNNSWADHQPEMQPLVDSGQIQIANHTWDHPDIRTLTEGQLVDQLDRNNRYLTGLYGVTTRPYFRPPYMGHTPATDRVCVDQGYSVITWWNGSFGDATQITADQVRQNARDYLRAGNIVIGHANSPAVTTVYDDIIGLIQDRALTTVTLSDVFTTANT
jgi:peptidoglycan/xylan/chitin deacetylase (PgdA/CDA1 family)